MLVYSSRITHETKDIIKKAGKLIYLKCATSIRIVFQKDIVDILPEHIIRNAHLYFKINNILKYKKNECLIVGLITEYKNRIDINWHEILYHLESKLIMIYCDLCTNIL